MVFASDVEYIYYYACKSPLAPAVIVNGEITTYRELWEMVCRFACYLKKQFGLCKGDIVLAKATQSLDYVILYYSVHLAGGILAPVENTASGEGFDNIVMEFSPCLIAVNPKDMNSESKVWKDRIIFNSEISQLAKNQRMDSGIHFSFPESSDLAVIMFTTGTTGVSKGVVHTQRSIIATVENMIYACEAKDGTDILTPGPMNHSGPIRKMVMAAVLGSAVILLNGMKNVRSFFEALDSASLPIGCALVPSAVGFLLAVTGDKIGEYKERIDFIISDSAPLPEPVRERLCRLLPCVRLYTNYGSTEAGSVCSYNYNKYPGKIGCIGKENINSKVVTVDEAHNVFKSSPENPGFLACIGDVNMKEYWKAPELTAQVMVKDMICTSDIGYIDSEGFIYILGRQGDVINVGGLKVAPAEVEDAALRHPSVAECICVPVDDKITGKAVKLCVVVKQGSGLDTKELRSYLSTRLENFKLPKYIVEIDAVPRTYNGKLDRKAAANLFHNN